MTKKHPDATLPNNDSIDRSIDRMTAYCTYCPKMCRFSCPVAEAEHRETVTPWGLMRLLKMVQDGSVEPSAEVAETFYHCTGCRRCQTWCRHENDVPKAMWHARTLMNDLGHVPKPFQTLPQNYHATGSPYPDYPTLLTTDVEQAFDPSARVAFLPDAETRKHDPELILRTGHLLALFNRAPVRLLTRQNAHDPDQTGSTPFACCGTPLLDAGFQNEYLQHQKLLTKTFKKLDLIITTSAALVAQNRAGTSWSDQTNTKVVHLIEFLAQNITDLTPTHKFDTPNTMLHDSCYLGRQLDLYEPFRTLASALSTQSPAEFQFNRAEASCCGAAGAFHQTDPNASEQAARNILQQMQREGGSALICGSPGCKKAFQRVGGKDAALDILELACRAFNL